MGAPVFCLGYFQSQSPKCINPSNTVQSQLPVPKRMIYPATEVSVNVANYKAAAAAIGGGDLYTPLFWDVN